VPEVDHTYATIAAKDMDTVRDAAVYVKLVDRAKRNRSQEQVQEDIRRKLDRVAGIVPNFQEAGSLGSRKPLMVSIRGENIDELKKYGAALKAEMYRIPGIVDMEVSLEQDTPEFRLKIDREKTVNSGVMTSTIVRTVGALVGGQAVTTYEDEDGDAIDVRVRLPQELRQDPSQVGELRLSVPQPGGTPALVALGGLATYERSDTPSQVDRADLSRQVMLSANLEGLALGTAVEKVKEAAEKLHLSPGYKIVFAGEAEDMAESFGYLGQALILAIILVYLILAAQFESFVDPLSIMLSLPLSLIGMAAMLALTHDAISMISLIGLIMLMGLVTKNAILLVDYAKTLRSQGMERRQALITAGRTRLRPIMMTTLAMIFGMLPIALAIGAGAEMRAPIARAVIGGLITSTVLTLLVVPVMYALLDDAGAWFRRRKAKPAASDGH
jgi:hydrophobic/amphiphilic exporter-1 (mainly G- bacteria), HAE1 family